MSEDTAAPQLPQTEETTAAESAADEEPKQHASGSYKCLCGACSYTVEGAPALCVICHCESCRTSVGGPCLAVAYPPPQFKYGEGTEESLIKYESAPKKFRLSCKKCGCAVHNILPNGAMIAFLGNIKWDTSNGGAIAKPTGHIWVSDKGDEDITDALPQFPDWPQ